MSKIRFLKCSGVYPDYLSFFYKSQPGITSLDYTNHHAILMGDCFGWADFWQMNLEATGNFECREVVVNAEFLQKKWASEHDITWTNSNWMMEILEAQIAEFKPEILFTHDYSFITPEFRKKIRKKVPSIRTIIGYDGNGMLGPERFSGCDIMLSCVEFLVERYNQIGFKSFLFKPGFESTIIERVEKTDRNVSCSFVGGIEFGSNGHEGRMHVLAAIAKEHPVSVYSNLQSQTKFWRSRLGMLKRGDLINFLKSGESWSDFKILQKRFKPGLFGIAMYQLLAESKISINVHSEVARNLSGNMRLFEATGMGACLVTDKKDNLSDYFIEGSEIVSFTSPDDATDKISWLLRNPEQCDLIGKAGQARTHKTHTFAQSVQKFLEQSNIVR